MNWTSSNAFICHFLGSIVFVNGSFVTFVRLLHFYSMWHTAEDEDGHLMAQTEALSKGSSAKIVPTSWEQVAVERSDEENADQKGNQVGKRAHGCLAEELQSRERNDQNRQAKYKPRPLRSTTWLSPRQEPRNTQRSLRCRRLRRGKFPTIGLGACFWKVSR